MSAPFGTTKDGQDAHLYTLTGDDGIVVRVTDFGAAIVEVHLPDRDGVSADVALGFASVEGYQSDENRYFGATVGRVANRIAGASFEIDGRRYALAANEPPNAIHGGPDRALSKLLWRATRVTDDEVEFVLTSPDGEEGYPGELQVRARFTMLGDTLELRYRATTDTTTPVNLTNHNYWNLAGAGVGTVLDHEIQVVAERYTPTGDDLIPTGGTAPVDGPLDLREPRRIGERIGELEPTGALGYDHNFVVDGEPGQVRFAARLRDPASGRFVELHTDQPGVQFYAGVRLDGQVGKDGRAYERHGGVCLEPQHHPDALHHPEFPSILLEPGETYEHVSRFRFGTD